MDAFVSIVLVEPEIPPNTGTIGRLCVALDIPLFLVGKLGFEINDKTLKRAGLDYWEHLTWEHVESLEVLYSRFPQARFWYLTKKTDRPYYDAPIQHGDFLVFGKETQGLPEQLLAEHKETALCIPMRGKTRSINLSNAVSIVAYDAYRRIVASK